MRAPPPRALAQGLLQRSWVLKISAPADPEPPTVEPVTEEREEAAEERAALRALGQRISDGREEVERELAELRARRAGRSLVWSPRPLVEEVGVDIFVASALPSGACPTSIPRALAPRGDWPRLRSHCADVPRPCPYVSCRHHLYFDFAHGPPTGAPEQVARALEYARAWPGKEPEELRESCTLDVADRGEHTLEAVGVVLNLTRERIRQVELGALRKLRAMGIKLKELESED